MDMKEAFEKCFALCPDVRETLLHLGRKQVRDEASRTYEGRRRVTLFDELAGLICPDNAKACMLEAKRIAPDGSPPPSSSTLAKLLVRCGAEERDVPAICWVLLMVPVNDAKRHLEITRAMVGTGFPSYLHGLVLRECVMVTSCV
jgi:hypothetical protein